jgi:ribosomal protein S18
MSDHQQPSATVFLTSSKSSLSRSSYKGETIKAYTILEKSRHVKEWKESGLSQRQYASSKGIPEGTFKGWTRTAESIEETKSSTAGGGAQIKRTRIPEYEVENALAKYIDERSRLIRRDRTGLSWGYLQH